MDIDAMEEAIMGGDASLSSACVSNVKLWIENLSDEKVRSIVEKKQWVMEEDIGDKVPVGQIRQWMEDMLCEDAAYVFDTIKTFISRGEMPADILEIDLDEGGEEE